MDYTVISNVLSQSDFDFLLAYTKHQDRRFQSVDLGDMKMFAHRVPLGTSALLDIAIKDATGLDLQSAATFLRFNNQELDTSFRVHADSDINNKQIVVAAVFYLEDSDSSGTALFKHPVYGNKATSKYVFTEDDGQWEAYYKYYARANTMLIYNASLFHGRFPWKVDEDRRVIVKFMALRK